ncbi:putative signal transducing protein [Parahaliea mediterranea]|uniref:putative signal transducing protein n=1 Tax=Parahaliea mediterranea TaxID=651086 RepID=UPI000E2F74FA|nr:DUF2007 domain-containing protein [Parahaliea mediterranea]
MNRVFSHPQLAIVVQMRDVLAQAGIDAHLRNEYAAGAAGELAPIDTWPELWLARPRDTERALALIASVQQQSDEPDWQCASCNSDSPASFDYCWRCGADRRAGR